MKFAILAIVVAVLSYQHGSIHAEIPAKQGIDINRIINESINNLDYAIQSTISLAVKSLETTFGRALELSKKIIEQTTTKFNNINLRAKEEITNLKKSATEVGVDVGECTEEIENVLQSMPRLSSIKLKTCVHVQIDKALTSYTMGKRRINEQFDIVHQLSDEVEYCEGNTSCLSGWLGKIMSATFLTPPQISHSAIDTANLIVNAQTETAMCRSKILGNVTDHIDGLLKTAILCVEQKISEATSE